MLDHVTIGVTDINRSISFYDHALKPLGIKRLYRDGDIFAGYGVKPKAFFWIGIKHVPLTGVHIAFTAKDQVMVKRFYKTALKAGGTDNGAPGLRPHYHDHYYGAFILDPDGHNIEAVCHAES